MSAFASSDKPVAAAAAGAFALAVAYFSWSSAKKSATTESSRTLSTVPTAGVPSTPSGLRKAQAHVDPASTGAATTTNNAVVLTASEDDYSYSPSMLDNQAQTVTSFIAPEPFPDADVAAFFASFSAALSSGNKQAEEAAEEGDMKKNDAEDRVVVVAGSTRFDTAGRSSADVMAQCGALIASDAAFDGLKADAATDVVERAANLHAYVEWKQQQQQQAASSLSPTDDAAALPITTDPTTVGSGASADEKEKGAAIATEEEEGVATTMMAVPSEQLAALSALIDTRVDTIEKWREHEGPIIRSIVRMLREIREELANIDHYKVEPEQVAGGNKDDALQPAPLGEVVAKSGQDQLQKAGQGQGEEEEGEEGGPVVQRRDSIHPELVAKTAADIRERIRRLRGIVERLHTPLRELGPIGDLCNQLEAIASVLAGTE